MKPHGVFFVVLTFILMQFALNSCVPAVKAVSTATPTSSPTVQPSATPTPIPFQTKTPVPSPTPMFYTVQGNDTIIGIAKKLDLTPEAILMTNPGINPSALAIGSTLILPGEQSPSAEIFIEPISLTLSQPFCVDQFGKLRCVVTVTNETDSVVENISIDLYLIGVDGKEMEKISVPILLNALYPGESQPAIGAFDTPPSYNSVQAILSSAFMTEETQFSRDSSNVTSVVSLSWDGQSATVSGNLIPVDGKSVWIAVIGFDKNGNLCATRRWEWNASDSETEGRFSIDLVSFAAPMEKVTLLVESWSD